LYIHSSVFLPCEVRPYGQENPAISVILSSFSVHLRVRPERIRLARC
jgi:hypothetical protein